MKRTMDFYAEVPIAGLAADVDVDVDMLIFQYGCYDWGAGDRFQIGVTRQMIAAGAQETMSQLSMTFFFAARADWRRLPPRTLWCSSQDRLAVFRATVLEDEAFAMAQARQPVGRELTWGPV